MRVICIDLWNTLIRSRDPSGASYEQALIDGGADQEAIYPFVRSELMTRALPYSEMGSLLCAHLGITDALIGRKVVGLWELDNQASSWFPGALVKLKALSQLGKLVLITNITEPGWKVVNARLRIEEQFDRLFLSYEQGCAKPDRRVWDTIEQWYPDASEFWMVGDRYDDDIQAPSMRGWKTSQVDGDGISSFNFTNGMAQEES